MKIMITLILLLILSYLNQLIGQQKEPLPLLKINYNVVPVPFLVSQGLLKVLISLKMEN